MKYLVDTNLVNEEEFWREFENIISDYVDENLDDFIDQWNESLKAKGITLVIR